MGLSYILFNLGNTNTCTQMLVSTSKVKYIFGPEIEGGRSYDMDAKSYLKDLAV